MIVDKFKEWVLKRKFSNGNRIEVVPSRKGKLAVWTPPAELSPNPISKVNPSSGASRRSHLRSASNSLTQRKDYTSRESEFQVKHSSITFLFPPNDINIFTGSYRSRPITSNAINFRLHLAPKRAFVNKLSFPSQSIVSLRIGHQIILFLK